MDEPGFLGDYEVLEPRGVVLGVGANSPAVPILQADASLLTSRTAR
jgi:hypothetical protein